MPARNRSSTAEYLKFVRRMIRAAGRRVGIADPEDLEMLVVLRDEFEDAIQTAIDGLRQAGFTWESIGEAMGVSRQAALMRWGRSGHGQVGDFGDKEATGG